MVSKPKEVLGGTGEIPGNAAEAIGAMNGAMTAAMDRGRAAFAESARAWQEEALRFLSERLRRDGQTLEELRGARSYAEMIQIQHRWMLEAGQSYADEALRLSRLVAETAQSGLVREPPVETTARAA
jgi:hypothetical protein